jgi:hypothetical protein
MPYDEKSSRPLETTDRVNKERHTSSNVPNQLKGQGPSKGQSKINDYTQIQTRRPVSGAKIREENDEHPYPYLLRLRSLGHRAFCREQGTGAGFIPDYTICHRARIVLNRYLFDSILSRHSLAVCLQLTSTFSVRMPLEIPLVIPFCSLRKLFYDDCLTQINRAYGPDTVSLSKARPSYRASHEFMSI